MDLASFTSDDREDSLTLTFTLNNGIRLTITNADLGGELNEFDMSSDQARELATALLRAASENDGV